MELQITDQRPRLVGDGTRVLSTATEPAPDLSEPAAVFGGLIGEAGGLGGATPRVARVEPGPGVVLSQRGPYKQVYRPKTPKLIWGIGLTSVGGFIAQQTYSNFQAGEAESSADGRRIPASTITGGSTAILGLWLTSLAFIPDKSAPIKAVEAP